MFFDDRLALSLGSLSVDPPINASRNSLLRAGDVGVSLLQPSFSEQELPVCMVDLS